MKFSDCLVLAIVLVVAVTFALGFLASVISVAVPHI